jgi:pyruvate/2-oxoacid:ferredoxin oxidoreductase beta subunit
VQTSTSQQDPTRLSLDRESVPSGEYLFTGHSACPGCGAVLALRYVLKGLGPDTVIALTASCMAAVAGPMSLTSIGVPVFHCLFGSAASAAAGIRAGLDARGETDTAVVAWAGDGGTFDIGMGSLSGAAERNDNIIFVCYDNEAYMNTGIQRSSATPAGAWTMNTPVPRPEEHPKKNMTEIVANHRASYVATASISFPEDLIRKASKARAIRGFKFIHVISPCPPGWKMSADEAVKIGRLAVDSCVFPLYEIDGGVRYTINYTPRVVVPVRDYMRLQGRFSHLSDDEIANIQEHVDAQWRMLIDKRGV